MTKVLVAFARNVFRHIDSRLSSLPIKFYFADTRLELRDLIQAEYVFQVVVLPTPLPESEVTWWELFGELSALSMRPEILVCTRTADFRLWSSVLDMGGYEVITESFSPEDVQNVLLQACKVFRARAKRSKAT